jgi:hypothetical protein
MFVRHRSIPKLTVPRPLFTAYSPTPYLGWQFGAELLRLDRTGGRFLLLDEQLVQRCRDLFFALIADYMAKQNAAVEYR